MIKKIFISMLTIIVCLFVIEVALHFTKHSRFANPIYKKNYKQLYTLAPNQKYPFIGVLASTNSLGIRGEEIPKIKPLDTFRIISLGDSITFGVGLADNQTYPYLSGKMLFDYKTKDNKKIEVVNMGIGGYCIVYGLQHLKNNGLQLNPDVITMAFSGGNDGRVDRISAIKRLQDWDNFFGRSMLVTIIRNAVRRNLKLCEKIVPIEDYQRLLQEMVNLAKSNNKKLLFIVLPWRAQVYPYDTTEDVLSKYQEAVEKEKEGYSDRSIYYEVLTYSNLTGLMERGVRTNNIPSFLSKHFSSGIYSQKNDNMQVEKLNTDALKIYRSGNYFDALKKLFESERICETYPMTHYYLGVVYGDMGNISEMNKEFDKSVELSKSSFLQYQTTLRKVAKANNISVADVLIAFQIKHKEGFFIDQAHHSVDGARVVAEEVKRALLENNLI